MTQLFTRKETAATLRISRSTLDNHISGGRIRATKLGKRVLISADEIYRVSHPSG